MYLFAQKNLEASKVEEIWLDIINNFENSTDTQDLSLLAQFLNAQRKEEINKIEEILVWKSL